MTREAVTPEEPLPDPAVQVAGAREIAADLLVIPNQRVGLVPNIGVIGGDRAVLVVETGIGTANAEQVLACASELARGRLFRGLGEPIADRLEGVPVPTPDLVYDAGYDLDLGGRTVRLRSTGRGHTKGDQVVEVPDAGVLFTGDLAETGQFAIFPWFPPYDTDVSGVRWLAVLDRLAATDRRVVVPGHGDIGGPQALADVRDHLRELRDETWRRRDFAMGEDEIVTEVRALLIDRHPEWTGQEWIERGVGCLCAEHTA
ncbi:MBL fold metallo-hydrolase [Streptomyces sp. NBC_00443]|uniref:MBL fold metallo-hydrolase n=1 Tax=Streptomyces sp. NBC_00443 TaxID=2975743 RepID=UPI002E1BBABD